MGLPYILYVGIIFLGRERSIGRRTGGQNSAVQAECKVARILREPADKCRGRVADGRAARRDRVSRSSDTLIYNRSRRCVERVLVTAESKAEAYVLLTFRIIRIFPPNCVV